MADQDPTPAPQPQPMPPTPAPTPPTPEPTGERITLTTSQLEERLREQEARTLAKVRTEQEQKDKKAAQARMEQEAEWQKLAEDRKQALAEVQPQLESMTTRYTALAERLGKQIDTGMKDWPAEARRMVPQTDDIATRLDAYENMRGLLEKGTLAPRQPGNGPNPRPATGPDGAQRAEEAARQSPRYTSF